MSYNYPNQPQQQYYPGTVVVGQPQSHASDQAQNIRKWSSGICGCCEDVSGCCYCYWCFPCFTCTLATKMDECACGPICCYGFLIAMRTKLRTQYGIKGTIFNDVLCTSCCTLCAAHQMYRELKTLNV